MDVDGVVVLDESAIATETEWNRKRQLQSRIQTQPMMRGYIIILSYLQFAMRLYLEDRDFAISLVCHCRLSCPERM